MFWETPGRWEKQQYLPFSVRRLPLTERDALTLSHPVAGKEECFGLGEGRISSRLWGVCRSGDCCWWGLRWPLPDGGQSLLLLPSQWSLASDGLRGNEGRVLFLRPGSHQVSSVVSYRGRIMAVRQVEDE